MITLDTLELPIDLLWADEFEWSFTEQAEEYSLGGSLLVETSQKLTGRPITLQPHSEKHSWVTRALILDLQAYVDTPGKEMVLTLADGRTFDVQFRFNDGLPLEARPKFPYYPPAADDFYTLAALRLMEV